MSGESESVHSANRNSQRAHAPAVGGELPGERASRDNEA